MNTSASGSQRLPSCRNFIQKYLRKSFVKNYVVQKQRRKDASLLSGSCAKLLFPDLYKEIIAAGRLHLQRDPVAEEKFSPVFRVTETTIFQPRYPRRDYI